MRRFILPGLAVMGVALVSCAPDYSPNTYASSAVQQANKVEQGVVVGVRNVDVSASGAVGAATGAAAGGIAGSQTPGGVGSAFGALGGALVGGLVGSAAEHATGDTQAIEYIVRKGSGELVSVTQRDAAPLPIGQKVLVIAGSQARIVPDYTVSPDAAQAAAQGPAQVPGKPAGTPAPSDAGGAGGTAPFPAAVTAVPLAPPAAHAGTDADRPAASDPSRPVPLAPPPPPLAAPVAPEVIRPVGVSGTTP